MIQSHTIALTNSKSGFFFFFFFLFFLHTAFFFPSSMPFCNLEDCSSDFVCFHPFSTNYSLRMTIFHLRFYIVLFQAKSGPHSIPYNIKINVKTSFFIPYPPCLCLILARVTLLYNAVQFSSARQLCRHCVRFDENVSSLSSFS